MNVILTCLLNSHPDPQRGTTLAADPSLVGALTRSTRPHATVVLTDCLTPGIGGHVGYTEREWTGNVYFARWALYAHYLTENDDIENVWCVDGTDVTLLRDPWPILRPSVLHIGSEPSTVGSSWMRTTNPDSLAWIERHANNALLNPGLVGGDRETVIEFARAVASLEGRDLTDMGAANRVAYAMPHLTGSAIHTTYKAYADNGMAAWMHK